MTSIAESKWQPVKTVEEHIAVVFEDGWDGNAVSIYDQDEDYSPDLYEMEFFAYADLLHWDGYTYYIPRTKRLRSKRG